MKIDKQKPRAFFLVGALFLIFLLLTISFGYETFRSTEPLSLENQYTKHVAFVSTDRGSHYWQLIERSVRSEAVMNGIYLESVGSMNVDIDEALLALDRMIATDVDGIIMQGIAGEEANQLVFKAKEMGIPVVTVHSDMPLSQRHAFIGANHFTEGEELGYKIEEQSQGEAFIGIITGSMELVDQQERLAGLQQVFADNERMHVVDIIEATHTEFAATQATYSLMRDNPQLTTLISLSELNGNGMIQGVQESMNASQPAMYVFDYLEREEFTIKGEVPEQLGKAAMEELLLILEGEKGVGLK
ncbi:ribose transport system substrate-binding protein [Alkalihalobacillus xiaoxiensis]|uniref:Ribose transport system substrate-binding protein n=1 Tax=Shouchella xiaoxiensis TaxID=766895 RepID=A0ABS2SZV0_9BACI|nr:substrate-binding domain-containing protein [Shouchella xiaoxiensis]MBM7839994.1 ribose transport system substrate-binding protein [Shouchella xiaoxiensis]